MWSFQAALRGSYRDLGCAPYGLYGVKYIYLVSRGPVLGVCVDRHGNLFVADSGNHRVRPVPGVMSGAMRAVFCLRLIYIASIPC